MEHLCLPPCAICSHIQPRMEETGRDCHRDRQAASHPDIMIFSVRALLC